MNGWMNGKLSFLSVVMANILLLILSSTLLNFYWNIEKCVQCPKLLNAICSRRIKLKQTWNILIIFWIIDKCTKWNRYAYCCHYFCSSFTFNKTKIGRIKLKDRASAVLLLTFFPKWFSSNKSSCHVKKESTQKKKHFINYAPFLLCQCARILI